MPLYKNVLLVVFQDKIVVLIAAPWRTMCIYYRIPAKAAKMLQQIRRWIGYKYQTIDAFV